MACDICLKPGECQSLNALLDWSPTNKMVICDSCARVSNKMLSRYREAAWNRVKKKLKQMHKEARKK